nr:MAG TPA: hypothetical protein [Caudoviricetes sp.]
MSFPRLLSLNSFAIYHKLYFLSNSFFRRIIFLISPLPPITRDIHPSSHDDTLPFYENNER